MRKTTISHVSPYVPVFSEDNITEAIRGYVDRLHGVTGQQLRELLAEWVYGANPDEVASRRKHHDYSKARLDYIDHALRQLVQTGGIRYYDASKDLYAMTQQVSDTYSFDLLSLAIQISANALKDPKTGRSIYTDAGGHAYGKFHGRSFMATYRGYPDVIRFFMEDPRDPEYICYFAAITESISIPTALETVQERLVRNLLSDKARVYFAVWSEEMAEELESQLALRLPCQSMTVLISRDPDNPGLGSIVARERKYYPPACYPKGDRGDNELVNLAHKVIQALLTSARTPMDAPQKLDTLLDVSDDAATLWEKCNDYFEGNIEAYNALHPDDPYSLDDEDD